MRLIYTKDGFTKNEKEEWRIIIFNNILDGLRMTVDAMEEYGIKFEHENTSVSTFYSLTSAIITICAALDADLFQVHLPTIMQDKDLSPYEPIPAEYPRAFKDMWKDAGVQKAIARGNEFALFDNLE
jgi:guanine nucleotide-binding protein subunit alpha